MAASQVRKESPSNSSDYEIAEEEEYYVTRPHSSTRRYKQPMQRDTLDDYSFEQTDLGQRRRASRTTGSNVSQKPDAPATTLWDQARHKRMPWLAVLAGMLVTLALVIAISSFGSWWQMHQNDATYGRPRTYQVDVVVGHQDSVSKPSHFIFTNLNRHVIVVEFPGGDASHAVIYTGPTLFGDGGDLIPVTGDFRDVNGDGRPDMIVHIQDQTIVFINDGTKFRPLQANEHITL